MGDKEERKKKKKSKKAEEEVAPEPAPEPEEEQWPPADTEQTDDAAAEEGDEAGLEGEQGAEDLMEDEFPEIEKKKSPFPVFWDRPKAKFYRMNFDYGENYYRDMMDYLNSRAAVVGRRVRVPPPAKSWAERAHNSASQRYPKQDSDISNLLTTIRGNIRSYEQHHRQYTANIQNVYGPKVI